jgi:hypothetical protein
MTVSGNYITLQNISSNVVLQITYYNTKTPSTKKVVTSVQNTPVVAAEETAVAADADAEEETTGRQTARAEEDDAQAEETDDAAEEGPEQSVLGQMVAPDITVAEVKDGAAVITDEIAETHMVEENGTTVLVLPLKDRDDQITKISISKETLRSLAEDKEGILRLQTSALEAEFDNAALRAIIDQAEGDDIYLDVKEIATTSLGESQLSAIEDKVVLFSFSAEIMSGDTVISQFYDGSATIRIPFEPEEGIDISEYAVVYIPTEGELEVFDSTYEDGKMILTTSHFSEYAIVRDASLTAEKGTGATYMMWILFLIILAALCIIIFLIFKKRQKRDEAN